MSNDNDYDNNDEENEHPAARRQRESAEKRESEELKARLVEYERKDLVRDAGLELNDKQLKALWAAHDGESTPDALKATAASLGFAKEDTSQIPAEEVAAHQRVASASTPLAPPPPAMSKLVALHQQAQQVGVNQLSELYPQVLAAIQEAGGEFVNLDHSGRFE